MHTYTYTHVLNSVSAPFGRSIAPIITPSLQHRRGHMSEFIRQGSRLGGDTALRWPSEPLVGTTLSLWPQGRRLKVTVTPPLSESFRCHESALRRTRDWTVSVCVEKERRESCTGENWKVKAPGHVALFGALSISRFLPSFLVRSQIAWQRQFDSNALPLIHPWLKVQHAGSDWFLLVSAGFELV